MVEAESISLEEGSMSSYSSVAACVTMTRNEISNTRRKLRLINCSGRWKEILEITQWVNLKKHRLLGYSRGMLMISS